MTVHHVSKCKIRVLAPIGTYASHLDGGLDVAVLDRTLLAVLDRTLFRYFWKLKCILSSI